MSAFEITAQAIGIVAMAFNILSYQQKTQKTVILFQMIGGMLFAANFLMLGAIVGGIMNIIAAARAIVFMNKKIHSVDKRIVIGIFAILYALSYILTFTVFEKEFTLLNGVLELLPVIAMMATTVSFCLRDARSIRRYGLISSPLWLIYNSVNLAIGAIICEVLSLISILIGIIRLDRKRD